MSGRFTHPIYDWLRHWQNWTQHQVSLIILAATCLNFRFEFWAYRPHHFVSFQGFSVLVALPQERLFYHPPNLFGRFLVVCPPRRVCLCTSFFINLPSIPAPLFSSRGPPPAPHCRLKPKPLLAWFSLPLVHTGRQLHQTLFAA